jgi:hypothetical protein
MSHLPVPTPSGVGFRGHATIKIHFVQHPDRHASNYDTLLGSMARTYATIYTNMTIDERGLEQKITCKSPYWVKSNHSKV